MFEWIQRVPDVVTVDGKTAAREGMWRFFLRDIEVRIEKQRDSLAVYLTSTVSPVSRVRLRWRFDERLVCHVLGDAWERSYADLGWQNLFAGKVLPWYVLLQKDRFVTGYGVKVRPGAICSWQLDQEGVTLNLDVRCGGEGVLLSGRTLAAAQVVCRQYEGVTPFAAARQFCRAMCDDPLLPGKPVYGTNNWYYAYGHSSREQVLKDAAYLEEMTRRLENRPYLVIDDGWQYGRYRDDGTYDDNYNGGPWVPNKAFGDMGTLAEEIRSHGILPGIWVRLLQDVRPGIPDTWRLPGTNGLDPSRPEVISLVKETVDEIGGWGYRLLKHDFSTYDIFGRWGRDMPQEMAEDGWHFADRSRTTAEIIVEFYGAILEAARRHDMLVLGCNTIGHLGAGLMHLHRTGDDTSGRQWSRTLRYGVNTLAFRICQHDAFFAVDADCIGISYTVPWEYNRQWGELLAKSGTPFFYSAAPYTMIKRQEGELKRMLELAAEARDVAEPLDWQDTSLPQDWVLEGEKVPFHWVEWQGI